MQDKVGEKIYRKGVKDMKRLITAIFLFVLIGLMTGLAHAQQTQIYGRVTDSSGGGVNNVHVAAYVANGPPSVTPASETYTADGGYYVSPLSPGVNYKLAYTPPFDPPHLPIYVDQWYNNKPSFYPADIINLTDNQQIPINPVLVRGGIIQGTVTPTDANLIPGGITVQVSNPGNYFLQVGTSSDGYYQAVVPGGDSGNPLYYNMMFNPYPHGTYYLPQCYNGHPNATPLSQQETVSVINDGITTIDAELKVGAIISGKVTYADQPGYPTGVKVAVWEMNGKWVDETGVNPSDGTYMITVPAGQYLNYPTGPYNVNTYHPSQSSDYHVYHKQYPLNPLGVTWGQTTSNIDFAISKGGKISGTVYNASTLDPIPNACVSVEDLNGNRIEGGPPYTGSDGKFTTPTLPAGVSYKIRVDQCSASGDYSFPQYSGPVPVLLEQTTPVNIGINRTATISVTLSNSNNSNQKISNVNVSVRDLSGNWIAGGATDSNGQTFIKVSAGNSYQLTYNTYNSGGYYLSKSYSGNPVFVPDTGITITDTLSPLSQVSVDIKPGIDPNPIKINCETTLPVAILSSGNLNIDRVNPGSITINGAQATNYNKADVNNDGSTDLILNFEAYALGLTPSTSSIPLTITGTLNDGTPISGTDSLFVYSVVLPTIFDDFSLGSLDYTKWTYSNLNYGYPISSPAPYFSNGEMILELDSFVNNTVQTWNAVTFKNSIGINSFKSKVKILQFDNTALTGVRALLGGFFYGDTAKGSNIGSVWAQIQLGSGAGTPGGLPATTTPTAIWTVIRENNAQATDFTILASDYIKDPNGNPISISIETPYTLYIGWDGSKLSFSVDEQYKANYTPTTNIFSPGFGSVKQLRSNIVRPDNNSGASYKAYIKASFDDVEVPSMANYTPSCSNVPVQVQPVDTSTGQNPVSITYDQVAQTGETTLSTSNIGPTPPSGFALGNSPTTYYNLSTTAAFSGPITVCIDYSGVSYGNESMLQLLHYENEQWINITSSLDTTASKICGIADHFSTFAIFEREVHVLVDVKPGSDVNSINLGSQGLTPVAILSTADFDATTISPTTVKFAGVSPSKWNLQDVNKDGRLDLMLFFETVKLQISANATEATLSGSTLNGTIIWGSDMVRIVPQKK
jgi:hypothetical protein